MPQINALQQLRRVVETAPDELLHMNAVVSEASCGTARCAIGWCIVDPWFQKNTDLNDLLPADWSEETFGCANDESDAVDRRMIGIADIFGLGRRDTDYLFGANLSPSSLGHEVTKAEVLWNIDELLAGRHALPYRATALYAARYAGDR